MSTRFEGATVLITVTACATLSAGPVHLSLSAREGPAPGPRGTTSMTARTTAPRPDASQG
jgi:hypothetical protein